MTRLATLTLLASLALLSASPTLHADTFVVDDDGGPGVDFTTVVAAVDAAEPGDTIVVRAGWYDAPTITEGVTLVAEGDDQVWFPQDRLVVHDLPAGQTLRLAGLEIDGGFELQHCDGAVLIDGCLLVGNLAGPAEETEAIAPLLVADCALVVVSRSRVIGIHSTGEYPGGWVEGPWAPTQVAVRVERSRLVVGASELTGGTGLWLLPGLNPGAPAIHAIDADVIVQSSRVQGGDGASIPDEYFDPPGDGGMGAHVTGGSLTVVGREGDLIAGGAGGDWEFGQGQPGVAIVAVEAQVSYGSLPLGTSPLPAGEQIDAAGGSVTELVPPPPVLVTTGDARVGGTLGAELAGPAGALFVVLGGARPGWTVVPGKTLPLLLDTSTPLLDVLFGALNGHGGFALEGPVPADPALIGATLHLQAYVKPAGGHAQLSTAAAVVVR